MKTIAPPLWTALLLSGVVWLSAPFRAEAQVNPVVWASTVNVIVTNNSLEKTGGCDTCDDAGAISTQQITSRDGYVEFTVPLTIKPGSCSRRVGSRPAPTRR